MTTTAIPRGAIRIPVPDTFQQTDYTCGAASLRAVCEYYGVGPDTEREYKADKGMPVSGADPEHIIRALVKYGLDFEPFHRMSLRQLKAGGRPHRGKPRPSYKRIWRDGHWVVAIGYDANGVFFEDPSVRGARGFIAYSELSDRWHDWGSHYQHMYRYGISIWKSGRSRRRRERRTGHTRRAVDPLTLECSSTQTRPHWAGVPGDWTRRSGVTDVGRAAVPAVRAPSRRVGERQHRERNELRELIRVN